LEYSARTQRGVLGFLLVITVASALRYFIGVIVFDVLFYLQILLALFLLMSIFIRFEFVIDGGYLIFQTLFFSIPIYKKVLFPNQINQIKFIRIGWATKCAVIQVKKGFNVRITNFTPSNVFNDLIDFANNHCISISKTKDYLILEK
jgi:hypothetical protein